jgi:hypothetical protein
VVCLDILALYKNSEDEGVQEIVAKTDKIREQIDKTNRTPAASDQ